MINETLSKPHTAYAADPALYLLALQSLELATEVEDRLPHPQRRAQDYGELPYPMAAQILHQTGEVWA